MSRFGVKTNLVLRLQTLKPFSKHHSCAIRLASKRFVVDMNLSYFINSGPFNICDDYWCIMGKQRHGLMIKIDVENKNYPSSRALHVYNVNYQSYSRNKCWFSYVSWLDRHKANYLEITITSPPIIVTLNSEKISTYSYLKQKGAIRITLNGRVINYCPYSRQLMTRNQFIQADLSHIELLEYLQQ